MEKIKNSNKFSRFLTKETILTVAVILFGIGSFFYGAIRFFDKEFQRKLAVLTMAESITSILVALIPAVFKKLKKIKFSFPIIIVMNLYMFLTTIGEVFELFYIISFWDSIIHVCSGLLFALLGCGALDFLLRNSEVKCKAIICIIFGIAISLAFEVLWEVLEFSIDSITGSNLQTFIPEMEPFFPSGGLSQALLGGTDAEIAAFFRTPEGYRYALMDTMIDIICNLVGVVIFGIIFAITPKKYKDMYSTVFTKIQNPQ